MTIDPYRVSTLTKPEALAGAIASHFPSRRPDVLPSVPLECIGAGPVNQAVKAVAIARGFTAPNGYRLAIEPEFRRTMVAGDERTMVVLNVVSLQ